MSSPSLLLLLLLLLYKKKRSKFLFEDSYNLVISGYPREAKGAWE
jgi:hypothetical protein